MKQCTIVSLCRRCGGWQWSAATISYRGYTLNTNSLHWKGMKEWKTKQPWVNQLKIHFDLSHTEAQLRPLSLIQTCAMHYSRCSKQLARPRRRIVGSRLSLSPRFSIIRNHPIIQEPRDAGTQKLPTQIRWVRSLLALHYIHVCIVLLSFNVYHEYYFKV